MTAATIAHLANAELSNGLNGVIFFADEIQEDLVVINAALPHEDLIQFIADKLHKACREKGVCASIGQRVLG